MDTLLFAIIIVVIVVIAGAWWLEAWRHRRQYAYPKGLYHLPRFCSHCGNKLQYNGISFRYYTGTGERYMTYAHVRCPQHAPLHTTDAVYVKDWDLTAEEIKAQVEKWLDDDCEVLSRW